MGMGFGMFGDSWTGSWAWVSTRQAPPRCDEMWVSRCVPSSESKTPFLIRGTRRLKRVGEEATASLSRFRYHHHHCGYSGNHR
jgi:hypothetical protein